MLACLFCVGINILTREGFIFGAWSSLIRADDGVRFQLARPLSECLTCMASFYGAIFYGWKFGFSGEFSLLFLLLFFLIGVSIIAEIFRPGNKEAALIQKSVYLATILFFCFIQYQEDFFQSLIFMVCLAGTNYFVDLHINALQTGIESERTYQANSVDQAEAVEEIVKAIKTK
jgi:hypothetical protein